MSFNTNLSAGTQRPSFNEARVAPTHLSETAKAIHAAFAGKNNVQYAIFGGYALALIGFPRSTKNIDCIVTNGKFGAVKKILVGSQWWHPRVAAGSMTSYYTTTSGVVVQVKWFEAGVYGPRKLESSTTSKPVTMGIIPGGGLISLNATELLRSKIKAFAERVEDKDEAAVRWLVQNRRSSIDMKRALMGLEDELAAVQEASDELGKLLC